MGSAGVGWGGLSHNPRKSEKEKGLPRMGDKMAKGGRSACCPGRLDGLVETEAQSEFLLLHPELGDLGKVAWPL